MVRTTDWTLQGQQKKSNFLSAILQQMPLILRQSADDSLTASNPLPVQLRASGVVVLHNQQRQLIDKSKIVRHNED